MLTTTLLPALRYGASLGVHCNQAMFSTRLSLVCNHDEGKSAAIKLRVSLGIYYLARDAAD